MRILVISPYFVPQANSEALCAAKWVLALQEAGADIVVLRNSDSSLCLSVDSSPFWIDLVSKTFEIQTNYDRNLANKILTTLRYQTWAWPRWISIAVRRGIELHTENPFDLIVGRSLPWYSCVAAYWTAKAIQRPWIANINDPWQLWQFSPDKTRYPSEFYQLLVKHWLNRCLTSAKRVVFPCSRLARYFERTRHAKSNAIIPHIGWNSKNRSDSAKFILVHAGLMGANEGTGRSGLALLQGLARFLEGTPQAKENCLLKLVGPEDPGASKACHELNIEKFVRNVGRVSYEESLEFIGKSSVCVLVEGQMQEGIFLPSKLADYLRAYKPVLALSPPTGTVADFSTDCGIFRVDSDNAEGVSSQIRFLYERFKTGKLWRLKPPESMVKQFEPQSIADSFLNIAEEVVNSNL
jgi:hypothetical protein